MASTGSPRLPDAPNLAGQKEIYLVRSLTAYKTGERQNPQMSVVAPTLSEEDIANLAAYYASIKITVTGTVEAGVVPLCDLVQSIAQRHKQQSTTGRNT